MKGGATCNSSTGARSLFLPSEPFEPLKSFKDLMAHHAICESEDVSHVSKPFQGHNPELILNNFVTRLGRRLARQFAALFPQRSGT